MVLLKVVPIRVAATPLKIEIEIAIQTRHACGMMPLEVDLIRVAPTPLEIAKHTRAGVVLISDMSIKALSLCELLATNIAVKRFRSFMHASWPCT